MGVLSIGEVVSKTASDFVGSHVGESQTKTNDILKNAKGKVLMIDEAYNLNDNLYGKQVLDTLVEKIQGTPNDDIAVLLLGYEEQMAAMLRDQNPGLARRFPMQGAFRFEDYTDTELIKIFNNCCAAKAVEISDHEVLTRVVNLLQKQRSMANFGNAGAVNNLLQSALLKATKRPMSRDGKIILIPDDIEAVANAEAPGGDPFAPLNSLFRVDNIKRELQRLQNTLLVAKQEGEDTPPVGHFVFRGSPGTGKTTVARVMADILFHMDLIASNTIVETSGLDLTGDYVGQTKTKVKTKLDEARGGVLFIDEAYKLGEGHYGEEALVTILEAMTSETYKGLVIIIAGYKADIETMLARNAGLKSRFNRYLDFEDWLPDDCIKFLSKKAAEKGFDISERALQSLRVAFAELRQCPGWANGRDVMQLWDGLLAHRADRLMQAGGKKSALDKKAIEESDVDAAVAEMKKNRKPTGAVSGCSVPLYDPRQMVQENFAQRDIPKVQENVVREVKEEEEFLEEEDEESDADDFFGGADNVHEAPRDAGVSDEDWAELEKAKQEHEEKMRRIKREKDAAARAEALRLEAEKQKKLQEAVRRICPCPAGFTWHKVGGGWRCAGGSHFVSDAQLQAQFTVLDKK